MSKYLPRLLASLLWASAASAMSVTASGYIEPHRPDHAIDGRLETQWTCEGECWLQVDYGEVAWFDVVFIHWLNQKKRVAQYEMAVSVDGVTWKQFFSGQSDKTKTYDTFSFPVDEESGYPGSARYLRIYTHDNTLTTKNTILDVELYEPDPESQVMWMECPYQPADPYNYICEISAISASSYQKGNLPALAVDGNLATHWTGLNGASLTLDLGSVTQVNDIRIAWKSGNKRRADHDIEVSEDGDAWTLVYSGLSTGKMLIPESHILDQDYFVRYVRITGHGNDDADPASRNKNLITEVEVWGYTWW